MIKIQKYQKYKLCMLYFPGVEGVTARQKMRFEIAKRPELSAALSTVQTNPKAKCFSEYEVSLIVEWLGQPPLIDCSGLGSGRGHRCAMGASKQIYGSIDDR